MKKSQSKGQYTSGLPPQTTLINQKCWRANWSAYGRRKYISTHAFIGNQCQCYRKRNALRDRRVNEIFRPPPRLSGEWPTGIYTYFFSRVKKHSAAIDTGDFLLLESQLILKTKKKCGDVGRARALSTQSRCRATAAQTKLLRERERKRNDADRVMSIISDVTYIEGSRWKATGNEDRQWTSVPWLGEPVPNNKKSLDWFQSTCSAICCYRSLLLSPIFIIIV